MVIALVGLIFILLLVFVLIIRGQSKKYAKKTDSGELAPSPAGWVGTLTWLPPFWQGRGLPSPGNALALMGGGAAAAYGSYQQSPSPIITREGGEPSHGGGGEATWSTGME